MKLKIFDNTNIQKFGKDYPPSVHIDQSGSIRLSQSFCQKLDIKANDSVVLAQDEEHPKDWYLITGQNGNGFPLRKKSNRQDLCSLNFNCKAITKAILKSINCYERSVTLRIATQPVEGTDNTYCIFTSAYHHEQ